MHYEGGYAYARGRGISIKVKADYPSAQEGKTIGRDGQEVKSIAPVSADGWEELKGDSVRVSLPSGDKFELAKKLADSIPEYAPGDSGFNIDIAGYEFDVRNLAKAVDAAGKDCTVSVVNDGKNVWLVVKRDGMEIRIKSSDEWYDGSERQNEDNIKGAITHYRIEKNDSKTANEIKEMWKQWGESPLKIQAEKSKVDEETGKHYLYSEREHPELPRTRRTISEENRKAAEELADALGYKVEWVDGMKDNGTIDHETKTIRIAMDAERPLEAVFGHEVTHGVRQLAGDRYDALESAAKKMVGEADWERRMDFKRRHTDYDEAKLAEEVVADIVGEAVEDRNAMRRLAEGLKGAAS